MISALLSVSRMFLPAGWWAEGPDEFVYAASRLHEDIIEQLADFSAKLAAGEVIGTDDACARGAGSLSGLTAAAGE